MESTNGAMEATTHSTKKTRTASNWVAFCYSQMSEPEYYTITAASKADLKKKLALTTPDRIIAVVKGREYRLTEKKNYEIN